MPVLFFPSILPHSPIQSFKDLDNTIGSDPFGSLVQASDGKLYGMTNSGGSGVNGGFYGVIFSFDLNDSVYTIVHDFDGPDGGTPFGSLIQAIDGKLYGITFYGGVGGQDALFSYEPSSSTYTKLKDFDNTIGVNPYGSFIQAGDGKFYGMTQFGLVMSGVIFSFDPASSTLTKIKDFSGANVTKPSGNLMQASDGKLYGMTPTGGGTDNGFIFSFDPASSTLIKLIDYDGANGAKPQIGSAFIEVVSGPLPVTLISFSGNNKGSRNQLSWKAANEQHLNYYELQRGVDGQIFKMVTQMKAMGNNSYTYNDPIAASASSLNYYRLKKCR